MNVLGIIGSPRAKGNTYQMVRWIMNEAEKEGAKAEIVALSESNIEFCRGCTKCFVEGNCPLNDDIKILHRKMSECDGLIFGAPAYALNVPAQTKVFIDRSSFLSHRPRFMGKFLVVVAPSGSGIGENAVAGYLKRFLQFTGFSYVGELTAMAHGPGIFPDKEKVINEAKTLGQALVKAIKDEATTHQKESSFVPAEELKMVLERVGPYLKADYEFWKQKGWL